jgi:CBS domain-containing protein
VLPYGSTFRAGHDGAIYAADLGQKRGEPMTIKDLMTRTVYTCHPRDSLQLAAQLMREHDCGCIPVLDDADRVVGMLTDRDICMSACSRDLPLSRLAVADAMSKHVFACAPNDSLDAAEQLMGRKQVRRVPVVVAGRLVGMLSLNDLALAGLGSGKRRKGVPRAAEIAETLAMICSRRSSTVAASAP